MPIVQVIRHVRFADLGSFASPLTHAGCRIEHDEAAGRVLAALHPLATDLVVVLGGPVEVGDEDICPAVARELRFLRARFAADGPTLGICLGAHPTAKAPDAARRTDARGEAHAG